MVKGKGFGVWGTDFKGFGAWALGFRIQGLNLGLGYGYMVQGL